jgi:hypothetical protein
MVYLTPSFTLQHLYCCHFKIIFTQSYPWQMSTVTVILKQNLIDGLSKKVHLSKFDRNLFSFCSTVFVFVMSLILGFSFSSYTELSIVFSEWNI